MKKIIILLALGYFNLQAKAQDQFNIGIKLGQNFSNASSIAVNNNTASYHVGATMHIGITKQWGITPEIVLSQTKLETNVNIAALLNNRLLQPETYHLNYLSIPILVEYRPFSALALQAGPQYSILIDQKKDGIGNAAMAFKSGEFAFVGGAQFNFGGFFAYGRYVVGLQNISELQDQAKWKTTQWQLGVGMSLLKF
jgi:hypothetical protein